MSKSFDVKAGQVIFANSLPILKLVDVQPSPYKVKIKILKHCSGRLGLGETAHRVPAENCREYVVSMGDVVEITSDGSVVEIMPTRVGKHAARLSCRSSSGIYFSVE